MKTRIHLLIAAGATLLLLLPRPGLAQESIADGVRLWSQNCGRCHNFRPAEERTDAEWAIIVSHMRARANLTKSTARAILAFLQASNVPEVSIAVGTGTADPAASTTMSVDRLTKAEWALLLELLWP